jgi:hypothetical protein
MSSDEADTLRIGIADCVRANRFEFSKHAVDQTILRAISIDEIRQALSGVEILEHYPEDKYGPSCLVCGFTNSGRPLHIQVTHPDRNPMKIITVYEPDPERWVDFRRRRIN